MFAVSLLLAAAVAQVQSPGTPTQASLLKFEPSVYTLPVETVDFQRLRQEDAVEPKHAQGGNRFAWGFEVDLNLDNSGVWERLDDGALVWRLQLTSPGAKSLNLFFSEYFLLPGNELYAYNADRTIVRGAFTALNNKENKQMMLAPIKGDTIILELRVAAGSRKGSLAIGIVNHAYGKSEVSAAGFGDSDPCNINTPACPYTDGYNQQVRSVAMILSATGSRRCTGALINNVRQDGRQLFLTAYHCLGGEANWIYMFNYESEQCDLADQRDGPTSQTVQGSRLLDSASESDFAILELTETIPASYNVSLAGFNAFDEPTVPFGIHHPSGDIKKYCYATVQTVSSNWAGSGQRNTHWQVPRWAGPGTGPGNQGDRTTTEPGSSGSPLFDPEGRIVGQLHGGTATCANPIDDYYGKVANSWDRGLSDVLDPDNTGTRIVDARELY
eukprot:TRINITY_DN435_c0_g1_i1.p1 TRINITY_DN435_c0_g1~~TRINITY_DN435_c0_g1_i1.p1  ORF type:complete len:443 (+),score=107.97 TRINITY_DN435_c0_g1_i1:35-1363(+)